MQASNGSIITTVIVCAVLLGLFGYIMMPTVPTIPTSDEIANSVLAGVNIPTAEEIANAIDIPESKDTIVSIGDDKDDLAESLAVAQLDDEDFREELAEYLSNLCSLDEDFDEDNIQSIDVADVEVDGFGFGNNRYVTITAKVNVDDDGDDEKIKLDIGMTVNDLVRDDDYEDAEVNEGSYNFDVIKNYNDFCD